VKLELDGENDTDVKKKEKWLEDNLMVGSTILHNMKDNIIPLF
jgi:hypothetical protein